MHRRTLVLSLGSALAVLKIAASALLAPVAARAAVPTRYKMQPILKIGDTVNGFVIKPGGNPAYVFYVGPLNDRELGCAKQRRRRRRAQPVGPALARLSGEEGPGSGTFFAHSAQT
jgi:hypothetical protein